MTDPNIEAGLESLHGQVAALRVFVMAIASVMPEKSQLLLKTQELLQYQRDMLIAQDGSEEFLASFDACSASFADAIRLLSSQSGT